MGRQGRRAELPGFVAMASVTAFVALVTVLANASRIATWTAGVIGCATSVVLGCTAKATLAAAAGAMAKDLLVAPVKVPDETVSVYPVLADWIERLLKIATPLTAFTAVVLNSVPPLGFVPSATVTRSVALVIVLPDAS